jgi:hypothetical protein
MEFSASLGAGADYEAGVSISAVDHFTNVIIATWRAAFGMQRFRQTYWDHWINIWLKRSAKLETKLVVSDIGEPNPCSCWCTDTRFLFF